jgi:hypothetical protein
MSGCLLLTLHFNHLLDVVWYSGTLLDAGFMAWMTWRRSRQKILGYGSGSTVFWSSVGLTTLWLIGTLMLLVYYVSFTD